MPEAHEGAPSHTRRKLLLVGGFATANLLTLGKMGASGARPSQPAELPGGGVEPPERSSPQDPPSLAGADAPPGADHVYDLVLLGGRVMDPESGFDDIAHVGIDGGTVTNISRERLSGKEEVDASDLVVAPGFIDILSYDPNPYGIWYKVGDGVTTNLGMHGIDNTAETFFDYWDRDERRPPTNFGGAFDSPFIRSTQFGLTPADAATPDQIDALAAEATRQVKQGWLGIDVEPEYTPEVTYDEIKGLAEVAAKLNVPMFFHGRYSDPDPPGTNADTLDEILRTAEDTGAAVHVEHITSTGGTFTMEESLATLDAARDKGTDVTACMYPYDYWATYLGSARFAEGWQDRFRISYGDLEIAGQGTRLTEDTFRYWQAQNPLVAAHGSIPEDDVVRALRSPWVMIGSDAILEESNNNHPRSTGCFARTLGVYVREKNVIGLMDGLAKMTHLPARRLEAGAPVFRRKGRVQIGADADLTVFDPLRIRDRSTIADPAQMSEGIEWVFVDGQAVLDPTGPRDDVRPGAPVRFQRA